MKEMDQIIKQLQEIERKFLRGTYNFGTYFDFTNELRELIEKLKK